MDDVTAAPLDHMAEAIERGRYENMATARWSDLREGERSARIDLMKRTLESSGITAALSDLENRAARSDEHAAVAARREEELATRQDEHDAAVEALSDTVTGLRAELAAALARASVSDARAERAESLVAAVRTVLAADAAVSEPEPVKVSTQPRIAANDLVPAEAGAGERSTQRKLFARAARSQR